MNTTVIVHLWLIKTLTNKCVKFTGIHWLEGAVLLGLLLTREQLQRCVLTSSVYQRADLSFFKTQWGTNQCKDNTEAAHFCRSTWPIKYFYDCDHVMFIMLRIFNTRTLQSFCFCNDCRDVILISAAHIQVYGVAYFEIHRASLEKEVVRHVMWFIISLLHYHVSSGDSYLFL